MTVVIASPSIDKDIEQLCTVITMDGEAATFKTPMRDGGRLGTSLRDIPLEHRAFQIQVTAMANTMLRRLAIRGYEYVDAHDIHIYGPFPSKMLHDRLLDPAVAFADARLAAAAVQNRPADSTGLVDYKLVADFVLRPEAFEPTEEPA